MKVAVIGGGASGIIAALKASEKHDVILLEGNDKLGKKLLITGNGRCNYWNDSISVEKYQSSNKDLLENILSIKDEVYYYLTSLGIESKRIDDYYYPYSNSAQSVKTILESALNKANVEIVYNYKVDNIINKNNIFQIYSKDEYILADKVIIATGGLTYPKTGSDGSGYILAQKYSHTVNSLSPSLVPLVTKEKCDFPGVRQTGELNLYIDDKYITSEIGEIQFNETTLSGICTFNISNYIDKYIDSNIKIKINFLKELTGDYDEYINTRVNMMNNPSTEELLESILNYKIIHSIIKKIDINKDMPYKNLLPYDKKELKKLLTEYTIEIIDTEGNEKAQVTKGGISLEELNINTLESKNCKGLYIVGELLDTTGQCGGFNLALAFISGYIAGGHV